MQNDIFEIAKKKREILAIFEIAKHLNEITYLSLYFLIYIFVLYF